MPKSHAAIVGAADAEKAGLPVQVTDQVASKQWQIWRLWAKYFARGCRFYENSRASKELPWHTE